jgi:integrase
MKTTDIVPAEGKREDILFSDRLKAIGIFGENENIPSGFALRVRPGKSRDGYIRSWILQYRHAGQLKRMTIGKPIEMSPAKALMQAEKLRLKIIDGGDPQADKRTRRDKDKLTFRQVAEDFLAIKTGRKNSLRALKGYLERTAKPLHSTPVDRITRKDISARVLSVMKSSGAPTAGCMRAALSSVFSWSMEMGLIEVNPVIGSFTPPQAEARDRVLSDSELASIWGVLGDDDYGKIVKLIILTGCRPHEIGGMAWPEFNFDAGTWTLPKERAKNHVPLTLPLSPMMLDVVMAVPKRFDTDCLFGARGVGFTRWSAAMKIFEPLGLKAWQLRDIRRSVATGMANIGIAPHIVETILNHISGHKGGVAGIYNRSRYTDQVKDALHQWSDHVASLVDASERKVRVLHKENHTRA